MKARSLNVKKKSMGTEKDVIKGVMPDINIKQSTHADEVGLSIGVTINMGNYESVRIDAWGVEPLKKGESRLDASKRLKEELIGTVNAIRSEFED